MEMVGPDSRVGVFNLPFVYLSFSLFSSNELFIHLSHITPFCFAMGIANLRGKVQVSNAQFSRLSSRLFHLRVSSFYLIFYTILYTNSRTKGMQP